MGPSQAIEEGRRRKLSPRCLVPGAQQRCADGQLVGRGPGCGSLDESESDVLHAGYDMHVRVKTDCSARAPLDINKLFPSHCSGGSRRESAIRRARLNIAGLVFSSKSWMSRTCFRGTTRVWPGLTGAASRKATQCAFKATTCPSTPTETSSQKTHYSSMNVSIVRGQVAERGTSA